MAKSNWDIKGTINKYEQTIQDGLQKAISHLDGEAVKTTAGQRGAELEAVDKSQLIASYRTEVGKDKAYLGNIAEHYIYVHYGTSEGKPGKTQPRPILTLVLDRNTKEVKQIIQEAINSV